MAAITYIEHDGTEHRVEVESGSSVMQGAVDNLIEGIVGECGGCCSCATCHCFVDESWVDRAGPANDMEKEMIEFAVNPSSNSRLGCQISVTDELDGLIVHLPESQY